MLDDGPGPGARGAGARSSGSGAARRRRERPGTGLGLAIAGTLAERWGGRASLSARPEGGTRAETPASGRRCFTNT